MATPLFPSKEVGTVWDTSAIIAIKERVQKKDRVRVLRALSRLASDGSLRFPREALAELERHVAPVPGVPDELVVWARQCETHAVRGVTDYDMVKLVLRRAPLLLDANAQHDEADPYVIALGLGLQDGGMRITVVTEDRKDKPKKMSLATACGLFQLPTVPLMPFLVDRGILGSDAGLV